MRHHKTFPKILILGLSCVLIQQVSAQRPAPQAYPLTSAVNYVQSLSAQAPITDPTALANAQLHDVELSTNYYDGMGRLLQNVTAKGSLVTDPSNPGSSSAAVDKVDAYEYDQYGRQAYHYLPFASTAVSGASGQINDGSFKFNPFQQQAQFMQTQYGSQGENWYYGQSNFEASPLNRQTELFQAGNNWAGTSGNSDPTTHHSVATGYGINTPADAVRIWTVTNSGTIGVFGTYSSPGVYAAGELYKSMTTDEEGHQSITFTDLLGRLVLKKVMLSASADNHSGSAHSGWLCTYFIYDDFDRLRAVIQPNAVKAMDDANTWTLSTAQLNEFCFRYEYDERGRQIVKKMPGVAPVQQVYDVQDRLVFSQDGIQQAAGQWLGTLYDVMNRPVELGMLSYSGSFSSLQSSVSSATTIPNTNGVQADVTLSGPTSGVQSATNSITMISGFSAVAASPFTTEIVGIPSTPINGIAVSNSPIPAGATFTPWSLTFYDNYSFATTYGSAYSSKNNSYDGQFPTATNTSWPYPQPLTQNTRTLGLTTGHVDLTVNLPSAIFYDNRNRVIQTVTANITGGIDVSTKQYNFTGQMLQTVQVQQKSSANPQTQVIATRNTYDDLGRPIKVETQVASTVNGTTVTMAWKTISTSAYDAFGRVHIKSFGAQPGTTTPIESMTYDYNIRGWLLGANRDYARTAASTANYFGFDLGYDNTNIAPSGGGTSLGGYAHAKFDGNVTGTVWKTAGDGEIRKYDYSYDAAQRLMGADFNEYYSGSFNKEEGIDFSVSNLSYDANGNLGSMTQNGWVLGGGSANAIDQLVYAPIPGTNRLQCVTDGKDDKNSVLGDFKYDPATKGTTDYAYDVNGNLLSDQNRKITSITYNYLNLPLIVTITGKGSVSYTYDVLGNKLKKVTTDNSVSGTTVVTTTTYLGSCTYQSRTTTPSNTQSPDFIDQLQSIDNGEGRTRPVLDANGNLTSLVSDYFMRDNLDNIRMVLSDEQLITPYEPLTFEDLDATQQNAQWDNSTGESINISAVRTARPGNFGTSTTNGSYAMLVQKSTGAIGATKLLKVMSGDRIHVKVDYYYSTANANNSGASPVTDFLTSLAASLTNTTVPGPLIHGGAATISGQLSTNTDLTGLITPTPSTSGTNQAPMAYLCVLFFDERFQFDKAHSVVVSVPYAPNTAGTIDRTFSNAIPAGKNGYAYVYFTNESNELVYFDNFTLSHEQGPVLEENHFYPFGLTMAGISSMAVKSNYAENKYRFGAKELQNKEFSDGSGLELYDFGARMQDPQIGRFHMVDPHAENYYNATPYGYVMNNPANATDPTGMDMDMTISPDQIMGFLRMMGVANGISEIGGFLVIDPDHMLTGGDGDTDPDYAGIEAEAKNILRTGDKNTKYADAFMYIYNHIPKFKKLFIHDLAVDKRPTWEPGWDVENKGNLMETSKWRDVNAGENFDRVTIRINHDYFDQFASDANKDDSKIEFASVLRTMYHEFIHVKQDRQLDGMSEQGKIEDEFNAYYEEAKNKDLPQIKNLARFNIEYGTAPIQQYLLSAPTDKFPALYEKYKDKVNELLDIVSPATKERLQGLINAKLDAAKNPPTK